MSMEYSTAIRMPLSKALSMSLLNAKVVNGNSNGINGSGVVNSIVEGNLDGNATTMPMQ